MKDNRILSLEHDIISISCRSLIPFARSCLLLPSLFSLDTSANVQRSRRALSAMPARNGSFLAARHGCTAKRPRARVLADRRSGGLPGGHESCRPKRDPRGKKEMTTHVDVCDAPSHFNIYCMEYVMVSAPPPFFLLSFFS